jgi:hypothetical protein
LPTVRKTRLRAERRAGAPEARSSKILIRQSARAPAWNPSGALLQFFLKLWAASRTFGFGSKLAQPVKSAEIANVVPSYETSRPHSGHAISIFTSLLFEVAKCAPF